MKREEMISKLSSIKACVANITYTYDVGLFFDVLSSEGVHSEQGYNIGQWPCFKFDVSEETFRLFSRIKKGEDIDDEELLSNGIIRELCTYHSYTDCWLVNGDTLNKCICQVKDELKKIENYRRGPLYAYSSLDEWNVRVAIFLTYEELQDFFLQEWSDDCRLWKEMSNEELNEWYQIAEENEWDGIPFVVIDK